MRRTDLTRTPSLGGAEDQARTHDKTCRPVRRPKNEPDASETGGLSLLERSEREFSSLHGIFFSGFPNMFMIGGSQGTLATTRTYDLTVQVQRCARIIEYSRARAVDRLEVRPQAEADWQAEMADKRVDHEGYFESCTPGLLNLEGRGGQVYDYNYGAGPVAYRRQIEAGLPIALTETLCSAHHLLIACAGTI